MQKKTDAARPHLPDARTWAKSYWDFLKFLFHNYLKYSIRLKMNSNSKSVELFTSYFTWSVSR